MLYSFIYTLDLQFSQFLQFLFLSLPSLTSSEEDGVELEAASILQPTWQLTEVTAVQVQGDSQGLSTALHLVTHWCVCNTQTQTGEMLTRLCYYTFGCLSHSTNENVRMVRGYEVNNFTDTKFNINSKVIVN